MTQSPSSRPAQVIVIGAGFAGLAAATALAEHGVTVTVVEARPGLGGRATAFRDPATRERIDNGQHVLAGCYIESLTFLRRIGSERLLHRPSTLRVAMIDERGAKSVFSLPPLPAPFHLLGGVLAWEALTWRDRLSMLRVGGALREAGRNAHAPAANDRASRVSPAPVAHISVRDWLAQHHQTPRLCALLWEPLALAALNQSIDDASAEAFLAVLGRMFGPDPEAARLLLPSVHLDELYAFPARDYLAARGSSVVTHASAQVALDGDRVAGVHLRDGLIAAPIVISSVPWFALSDLFAAVPAALTGTVAAASALGSAPIVTVNLWLEGFDLGDSLLGLPGRSFQWVFDRRRLIGEAQSHLSLVSSGAEAICALPNQTLIDTAMGELQSALPRLRSATLRHASVVRERRATFSLKPGPPRPLTRTGLPGFLLAGDWIDTGLPATIESAVVSGHAAARAALSLLQ